MCTGLSSPRVTSTSGIEMEIRACAELVWAATSTASSSTLVLLRAAGGVAANFEIAEPSHRYNSFSEAQLLQVLRAPDARGAGAAGTLEHHPPVNVVPLESAAAERAIGVGHQLPELPPAGQIGPVEWPRLVHVRHANLAE